MDVVLCLLSLGLACPSNPGQTQQQAQVQQANVQEVPEPGTIVASLVAAGIGYGIKKVRKPE